jgi:hypothetical protein
MMTGVVLIYIGAALPFLWGVAHLFPTRSVVRDFGDISRDNRNIIAMEWIIEGVALIFIGLTVAAVTYINSSGDVSRAVYVLSGIALIALAVISLFTGFRVNFLPFKLCPVIFTSSAVLITLGCLMIK